MDSLESQNCIYLDEISDKEHKSLEELKVKKFSLNALQPEQCCSVKIPFQALQPGKYTIQASLKYDQGEIEPLIINTEVESIIETELNIGIVMVAYTLTRLNLNFTLE